MTTPALALIPVLALVGTGTGANPGPALSTISSCQHEAARCRL
jgi:hypothetical protein